MKGDYESYDKIALQCEIMKNILANVFSEKALMRDCEHRNCRIFVDDHFGGDICLNCGSLKTWERSGKLENEWSTERRIRLL